MSRDTSSRTRIGVCQQGDLSSSLAHAAWMRASKRALLLGVQAQDLGEAGPRVGVVRDRLAVAVADRPRARHHAPGDDLDVVRGAARREHLAVRVADDAAGRRQDDAADDVLVRDGRVRRAVERLELEEAADDGEEREERGERHPLVALAELADVRARDAGGCSRHRPAGLAPRRAARRHVDAPARCGTRSARRPPSRSRAAASADRATAAPTRRARRSRGARAPSCSAGRERAHEQDLHPDGLRGEPDARGAREDERARRT